MVQQLSTNTFGTAKWIVSATASDGTHTTIGAALTSASSGDTIFVRPGTYTENITLKAGVNLTAYNCDSTTPNVTISGTCSFSSAGTVSISGIRLQTNSAALLSITGSAASLIYLNACYLNCTNNTGITYSTANTGAKITMSNCQGDIGTTGISLFTNTSTGQLIFEESHFSNSGSSTTASTCAAGSNANCIECSFGFTFTSSSTGNFTFAYCNINTSAINTTSLTLAGTGTSNVEYTDFLSGTASAISIGTGTTLNITGPCTINSSNTNAITGAGSLNYSLITYSGASSTNNVTTQTQYITQPIGQIVQQVRTSTTSVDSTSTAIPADDTIPQNTEGKQLFSLSITPKSTSHILVIEAVINISGTVVNQGALSLFQDSNANAVAVQAWGDFLGGVLTNAILKFYVTAGTTSSTTFNLRYGVAAGGNAYINQISTGRLYGGSCFSSMTITEYVS